MLYTESVSEDPAMAPVMGPMTRRHQFRVWPLALALVVVRNRFIVPNLAAHSVQRSDTVFRASNVSRIARNSAYHASVRWLGTRNFH